MGATRFASFAMLAMLAASCGGGGGGGSGGATSGGVAPSSVDPRLVGSYEASRWFYDYVSGHRIGNDDFDSTTWRLHLDADGTYDLYKEWWTDGHEDVKRESGRWSVGPPTESAADGTLELSGDQGSVPCSEPFSFSLPDDPDVALAYWRANGPTCDGTRPYVFYRVEWARTE
jgi:hypothetical protein